ncbi:MAG: entericidin A/B family lipoprotein [Acidobacteria bacterium]|nr:entericidin A/B family lipoprotein [Acidobacteriota bacterium]
MKDHFHGTWVSLLRGLALAATVVALLAGSIGCHTVRGVGRDVESVGRGVEDVSHR